jgi:hypothetical protein
MPTILELFKGSSKDITPKILDQTPVEDKFKGSTQEKSVVSDQLSKIEQEFKGVRFKSGVELNNPLLYGNQAIRIATRSTSDVEKMKQGTGGAATDGGLIGKGLGAITGGKFGKFVFGGKVTSLNQARDGINSRIGIPQNIIPTYVVNTGELQKGLESDTMVTLGNIKNDVKGTLVGKFLKQTGGGTPKTIGNQILGQGISLGKSKLRTTLFGNPNALGANNASDIDSFSGLDSGKKTPANGGWEYSSQLPYSKQINNNKFSNKSVKQVDKAATDITKKVVQLREDAKKKLGEATSNATAQLKKKLLASKPEIDKLAEAKSEKLKTNTSNSSTTYTKRLEGYKTEDVTTRIDLSLVSPIRGIDRRATKGVFGSEEYGFRAPDNNTGKVMPFDPTRPYSGLAGDQKIPTLETKYGLTSNNGDSVNKIFKAGPATEDRDLIPVQIKGISDKSEWVAFRALITGFTETVSPQWETSKFVGNPYSYHTYSGVERSASFNLKMYCMNPTELSVMWQKITFLTKKTYPTISKQRLVNAPFIKLTLGSIYADKEGYINSLSYTIADDITWETAEDNWLPKVVDVQLEFKLVEWAGSEKTPYSYGLSKESVKAINTQRKEENAPVVGTEPITTPTPSNKKSQLSWVLDTPPAELKINNKGVEQTAPAPSETSKPKMADTGKPADTPQQNADTSTLTSIATTTKSEWEIEMEKRVEKLKAKGVPEVFWGAFSRADVNPNSVKKIKEGVYYYEQPRGDTGYTDRLMAEIRGNGWSGGQYDSWVSYENKGVDPMKETDSKTGKLQTALPF